MGIINWLMHRTMRGEAKRLAKEMAVLHPRTRVTMPDAPEAEVIRRMVIDEASYQSFSPQTKHRVSVCCSTVNGLCYMLALDGGKLKGHTIFRSLQFTGYVDRELEAVGFPKQTLEQKRSILHAMELDIEGWEQWSDDKPSA